MHQAEGSAKPHDHVQQETAPLRRGALFRSCTFKFADFRASWSRKNMSRKPSIPISLTKLYKRKTKSKQIARIVLILYCAVNHSARLIRQQAPPFRRAHVHTPYVQANLPEIRFLCTYLPENWQKDWFAWDMYLKSAFHIIFQVHTGYVHAKNTLYSCFYS